MYSTLILTSALALGILITAYVLHGIGLSKMLRSCGFKKPFFAYLPFFRAFALGSLADVFDDRREEKKRGNKFLMISIAYFALTLTYFIAEYVVYKDLIHGFISSLSALPETATTQEISLITEAFYASVEAVDSLLIRALDFVYQLVSIAYSIVSAIVLFRVFAIFDSKKFFIFTLISIFLPISQCVLFFIVRNNPPKNLRWQRKDDYEYPIL